jgi:hypothetical protein
MFVPLCLLVCLLAPHREAQANVREAQKGQQVRLDGRALPAEHRAKVQAAHNVHFAVWIPLSASPIVDFGCIAITSQAALISRPFVALRYEEVALTRMRFVEKGVRRTNGDPAPDPSGRERL